MAQEQTDKRKQKRHDTWKEKIKAGVLADRLYKHAQGTIEMMQTQINAAKILKTIAAIAAIIVTGPVIIIATFLVVGTFSHILDYTSTWAALLMCFVSIWFVAFMILLPWRD